METSIKRRRKKKYPCPNPLFEKWLTELRDDAAEKGLKAKFTYGRALSSLRKYPLPLQSGKEAKILEHFGDKICAMLDAKLLEWKQSNYMQSGSQSSPGTDVTSSSSSSSLSAVLNKPKSTASPIKIKTISKGRVTKIKDSFRTTIEQDVLQESRSQEYPCFYLTPGSFDILLCVDNCETYSGQGKNKKLLLAELQKCGVEFEVRKLHVGDFLWIARENCNNHRELVLDFIIERKRLDDFAHSIKDGRFREQKFRMRNCGLRSPIYLVEYHSSAKFCGLPESTMEQALVNTQIIDGFLVKRTHGIRDSVSYLSLMTRLIRNKYKNLTLVSASKESLLRKTGPSNTFMAFKEFNCSSIKNKSLTVKEMFAKHLLQFFGLSVDRAAAIVEHFDTPAKFFEAYEQCATEEEKIQMLSSIKFGLHKNKFPCAEILTLKETCAFCKDYDVNSKLCNGCKKNIQHHLSGQKQMENFKLVEGNGSHKIHV